jgi:hypothetical protein
MRGDDTNEGTRRKLDGWQHKWFSADIGNIIELPAIERRWTRRKVDEFDPFILAQLRRRHDFVELKCGGLVETALRQTARDDHGGRQKRHDEHQ